MPWAKTNLLNSSEIMKNACQSQHVPGFLKNGINLTENGFSSDFIPCTLSTIYGKIFLNQMIKFTCFSFNKTHKKNNPPKILMYYIKKKVSSTVSSLKIH